jgi:LacI family transcriptional regulator
MISKPTVLDVARKAGVSPATVSGVLNNDARVKPETVRTVREAVQELGYLHAPRGRRSGSRDRAASGRRTNRVALLAVGVTRAQLNAPVYMDLLHGVESALNEAGKVMVLRHMPPGEVVGTELLSQKVDGVLLFGPRPEERLVRRLREIPCVQMMGLVERDGLWDHVSYDNSPIGTVAASYLLARGHKVVACVFYGTEAFNNRRDMFMASVEAAGACCVEFEDPQIMVTDGTVDRADPVRVSRLVDAILAASPRPTGLFLVVDALTPSFYLEICRRGLTPGRDIDIISCNNERTLLASLHPRPATIDIHAEAVGRKAVEQLLCRIERPRAPRVTLALAPELVVGEGGREWESQPYTDLSSLTEEVAVGSR